MLSMFNLKYKTMENLKNLVLAASQKVEMNGVTDIKKLYPDSIVFDSIEEFEQHGIDRAVEYLADNYPDEEEYTSSNWMLATACDCEGDWLFLIDGNYYLMDYCDLDNSKVEDVQIEIWESNGETFANQLAEKLDKETQIDTSCYYQTANGEKMPSVTVCVINK